MSHRWHFFRAGGVDQVSLRNSDDLRALRQLDQKLWVALSMPLGGVHLDPETLAIFDEDNDGRIRVHDILAAVDFIEKAFLQPGDVLTSRDEVALSSIADAQLVAAAKRVLIDLGKPEATSVHIDDTIAIEKAFASTVLNGDGVIIPESATDPRVRRVITDVIAHVGSTPDRSGKPGIDQALADELFAGVDARAAWLAKRDEPGVAPLGDATDAAAAAFAAVRNKLDDYFTRCRIAEFDPRGAGVLAGREDELVALATRNLSTDDPELAKLPLAKPDPSGALPLARGINPAWRARMTAFVESTVKPLLGARETLTAHDVEAIATKLAPYAAWQAAKPQTKADALEPEWLAQLTAPELRDAIKKLIEDDRALAAEYDQIASVKKLVRLQRDGGRVLRNFVNFSDFYSQQDGLFQAGTLYLDARALHLCVYVDDAGKHSALAASSAAYLVYCEIRREGTTRNIMAAVTNGDADNLFVGRNGVFYDRDGKSWDATITKLVSNPISVREAFWSPYKKLVRTIEEAITRRASEADAAASSKIEATGKQVAEADKAPAAAPKKIDLGTVAALGVAIGGIGTLVGTLLGTMFGLGKWLPLGIAALLLMISGPSMLLAWLKLRQRNLGPILDANGWAINGRARINVAFGARMTELAALPKGSQRSLDDPFADKRTPWKRWVFLIVLVLVGASWWLGKLDRFLPARIQSVEVLGEYAPAAPKNQAKSEEKSEAPAEAPPAE